MIAATGVRPVIDRTMPLTAIHMAFQHMIDGDLAGKVVIHPPTPEGPSNTGVNHFQLLLVLVAGRSE